MFIKEGYSVSLAGTAMFSPFIFWIWFAGLIYLAAGLFATRREVGTPRGLDKLIAMGRVFVAASLAAFGAEHLVDATAIMNAVPVWMPARLFVTYFVGSCLIAAATSLTVGKFMRFTATALGVMFLLFVSLIHLPNVATDPRNRILWAVALRDLAFSGGAWALAGKLTKESLPVVGKWMVLMGRVFVTIAVLFFAVEQFRHPEFAPGVPLPRMTPAWFPLHAIWGYVAGAILLIAGVGLLVVNKRPRLDAALIGLLMTALTVFLYLPMLAQGGDVPQLTESLNYVFDTLLFGGMALLLASAL
jgi:uncharacterized membrane protein